MLHQHWGRELLRDRLDDAAPAAGLLLRQLLLIDRLRVDVAQEQRRQEDGEHEVHGEQQRVAHDERRKDRLVRHAQVAIQALRERDEERKPRQGHCEQEGVAEEEEGTLPQVGPVVCEHDAHRERRRGDGCEDEQAEDTPQRPEGRCPRELVEPIGAAREEEDHGVGWVERGPRPAWLGARAVGWQDWLLGEMQAEAQHRGHKVGRAHDEHRQARPQAILTHRKQELEDRDTHGALEPAELRDDAVAPRAAGTGGRAGGQACDGRGGRALPCAAAAAARVQPGE